MEKLFRKMIVEALRPLHAISVENGCGVGTPDVNFSGGWIELKELEGWPKRAGTAVAVPHFTQEQRIWFMKRSTAGGRVWLLLKVKSDFLLFDGSDAVNHMGKATQKQLVDVASWASIGGFVGKSLLRFLQPPCSACNGSGAVINWQDIPMECPRC